MSKFVRQPPAVFEDAILIAGGEVDEYRIRLGYYGDELNPDELSALLGRKPTSSSLKGDLVRKNDRTRIEKTGKWILSARETPGEPLEPQITDLLASMTAELSVWRSLAKRFRVRFVVGAWIRTWNRGLEISPPFASLRTDREPWQDQTGRARHSHSIVFGTSKQLKLRELSSAYAELTVRSTAR